METFVQLLQGYGWLGGDFVNYITKEGHNIKDLYSLHTSNSGLRRLIEGWLNTRGFTFEIECRPWEAKVYFMVYYNGDIFDMGVDNELVLMEGLKDVYINCVKKLGSGNSTGIKEQDSPLRETGK